MISRIHWRILERMAPRFAKGWERRHAFDRRERKYAEVRAVRAMVQMTAALQGRRATHAQVAKVARYVSLRLAKLADAAANVAHPW